jgi:hypothetical protein
MATDTLPPPLPTPPPGLPESAVANNYIEQQLDRTRQQVKLHDLAVAAVIWLCGLAAALLVLTLCDHWFLPLANWARWLAWGVLLSASAGYFALRMWPLLVGRINQVYAAKVIEDSQPNLNNSLLNYLLLKRPQEKVPSFVVDALSKRAAVDLSRLPAEHVIDATPLIRLGLVLSGLLLCLLFYKMLSPKDPFRSIARVMAPWSDITRASRVHILAVKPGNIDKFQGDSLEVSVEVEGLGTKEEVVLHYSTEDGQSVNQRVPLKSSAQNHFTCQLPPNDVSRQGLRQDLRYFISAGDAVSSEYQVRVLPAPRIEVEQIELTYPAYTRRGVETLRNQGDIKALEGTRVNLQAHANFPIATASIELESEASDTNASKKRSISVNMLPSEQTATGEFVMQRLPDGSPKYSSYRLQFTTSTGQSNSAPTIHRLDVISDLPPEIDVLNPAERRVKLPLDGTLQLEFRARDPDFGLCRLDLEMEVNRRALSPVNLFKEARGVQGPINQRYSLRPKQLGLAVGDELIFVGVAADNRHDNSGQLAANVQRSDRYSVTITEPEHTSGNNANPQASESGNEQSPEKQSQDKQTPEKSKNEPGQDPKKSPQNSKSEKNSESKPDPAQTGEKKNEKNNAEKNNEKNPNQEKKPGNDKQETGQEDQQSQQQPEQKQKGGAQGNESGTEQSTGEQNSGEKSPGEQSAGQSQKNGNQGDEESGSGNNPSGNSESGGKSSQKSEGNSKNQSGPPSEPSPMDANNPNSGDEASPADPNNANRGGKNNGGQTSPQPKHDGEVIEETLKRMQEDPAQNGKPAANNQQSQAQPSPSEQAGNPMQNAPENQQGQESKSGEKHSSNSKQSEQNQAAANNTNNQAENKTGEKNKTPNNAANSEQNPSQSEKNGSENASGENSKSGDAPSNPAENKAANPNKGQNAAQPPNQTGNKQAGGKSDSTNSSGEKIPGEKSAAEKSGNDKTGKGQGTSDEGEVTANDPAAKSATQPKTNAKVGDPSQEKTESGADKQPAPSEEKSGAKPSGDPKSGSGKSGDPSAKQKSNGRENTKGANTSDPVSGGGAPGEGYAEGAEKSRAVEETEAENLEYAKQATDLALQHLKDQQNNPDPELMKRLGWTKEELNAFLRRWDELKRAAKEDKEARPELDEAYRSLGLRPANAARRTLDQRDDTTRSMRDSGARSEPPAGYADQFRAFRKGVSKSKP